VRLQVIEYLNISGLVIDFATSPVRAGNSFFASLHYLVYHYTACHRVDGYRHTNAWLAILPARRYLNSCSAGCNTSN